jgi:hypothetical protein
MEGSLTQLGLTNYLINKKSPAVSFFQHSYKNYTNYVKDTRVLSFKNTFQFGQSSSFRFDEDGKYGDMVTNIVVEVDLPDISTYTNSTGKSVGYCNGVGNALAKTLTFNIGGNQIDQQTGEWLDIWGQLAVKPGARDAYNTMIQKYDESTFTATTFQGGKVYIPLQFWFCRNITNKNSSLVFPLLNLVDSTIELIIDIRGFNQLIVSEDGNLDGIPTAYITSASIIIDYVVLDEQDRAKIIKNPTQLNLLTQLQTLVYDVGAGVVNSVFSLKSTHYLVSELLFVLRRNDSQNSNNYFNYSDTLFTVNRKNPIKSVRLIFDGRDKIKKSDANIYSLIEPAKVHTNAPKNAFIHCVSFALEPEKMDQPNGVCNFSELQNPEIHLEFAPNLPASTLYIYAINYNVLQTKEGIGYLLHMLSKGIPGTLETINCSVDVPNEDIQRQSYKY